MGAAECCASLARAGIFSSARRVFSVAARRRDGFSRGEVDGYRAAVLRISPFRFFFHSKRLSLAACTLLWTCAALLMGCSTRSTHPLAFRSCREGLLEHAPKDARRHRKYIFRISGSAFFPH